MKADALNQYEAMFLLPAGASAEMEKSLATVRGMLERHGAQIIVLKKWDERKLAYELAGNKRGLYIIAYFRASGGAGVGVERDVNLSEEILRVLVTRVDHLNETEMAAVEPQPIQPREERPREPWNDDRRDRPPRREPRRDDAPQTAAVKD